MPLFFVLKVCKDFGGSQMFFYICRKFKNVLKLIFGMNILERVHVHHDLGHQSWFHLTFPSLDN